MTTPNMAPTMQHSITPTLDAAQRVVIKIGSLLLIDEHTNGLNHVWLASIVADIAELKRAGKEVIVVSSGAVALGRTLLNLGHEEITLSAKQAAAACGQSQLVEAWRSEMSKYDLTVGQILLTTEDTESRRRYLNARATINALLDHNVVPVINENDSISTKEIRYGDNDRLAAHVAAMSSSDVLVLLSDIDGLYTANPKLDSSATHIPLIDTISDDIRAMAGDNLDHRSSGGMRTKLEAAGMAVSAGCHMVIARGLDLYPIRAINDGARCSWFTAHSDPLSARKHWIANSVQISGKLIIDDGARQALLDGNSLLPAGVTAIEGEFQRGDTVRVLDLQGHEIARGLANYHDVSAHQIIGKHSDDIESILGFKGRNELIHRDDMVLMV